MLPIKSHQMKKLLKMDLKLFLFSVLGIGVMPSASH